MEARSRGIEELDTLKIMRDELGRFRERTDMRHILNVDYIQKGSFAQKFEYNSANADMHMWKLAFDASDCNSHKDGAFWWTRQVWNLLTLTCLSNKRLVLSKTSENLTIACAHCAFGHRVFFCKYIANLTNVKFKILFHEFWKSFDTAKNQLSFLLQAIFVLLNITFDLSGSGALSFCQKQSIWMMKNYLDPRFSNPLELDRSSKTLRLTQVKLLKIGLWVLRQSYFSDLFKMYPK